MSKSSIAPDAGSSGQMSYPLGRMHEIASQIISNANASIAEHDAAWNKVQVYVQTFPGFMQGALMAVLSPYEHRLRASYEWQIAAANTLIQGANSMEQTDNVVSQSFTLRGFGRNHIF